MGNVAYLCRLSEPGIRIYKTVMRHDDLGGIDADDRLEVVAVLLVVTSYVYRLSRRTAFHRPLTGRNTPLR